MMRQKLLFALGLVVRAFAYVAAIRVADAVGGSSAVLGVIMIVGLLGLVELGPLRWTDRATGITEWRDRRWGSRQTEFRNP